MESITVIIKTSKGMKEYTYEGNLNIPVTTLLERINVKHNIKIHYSSSCLQGLCGSCSMIINGLPKLACKTFVNEEATTKKMHKITIEPLSKFPVVNDLVVDRTSMFENIKNYPNIKFAFWFNSADYDPEYPDNSKVSRPYWLDETEETLNAFKNGFKK
jgi:succinate dehydrogenase / fumarate reductase iron-sulfur subunit